MDKQQQLTPFERAAYNREQGLKRIAGIVITSAWIERLRALRRAKQHMSVEERLQWNAMITKAAVAQHEHFGYDA
jgi:hypothetical protein